VAATLISGDEAVPAASLNETVGLALRVTVTLPLQVGLTVVWLTVRVFGGWSLVVALTQEQVVPAAVTEPSTRPVAAWAGVAAKARAAADRPTIMLAVLMGWVLLGAGGGGPSAAGRPPFDVVVLPSRRRLRGDRGTRRT
jgi:hypothetical protein